MYAKFFGLRCRPFEDRADPQFTYATEAFAETLAALEYEIHNGRGLAMVIADAGIGKTQLVRTLLQRLHSTDQVIVLPWQLGEGQDLVREVCKAFGVSLPGADQTRRRLARLRRHLLRTAKANHRSVLIIDQAENLSPDQLNALGTITEWQHDNRPLLSNILVGQPRLRRLLNESDFDRLRRQMAGERVIPPLSALETQVYVRHRLRVAGVTDDTIFDDDAVNLIHHAALRIPRLINHFCNASMLAAYGAGLKHIDRVLAAEVTRPMIEQERTIHAGDAGLPTAAEIMAGLPNQPSETITRPQGDRVEGGHRQPSTRASSGKAPAGTRRAGDKSEPSAPRTGPRNTEEDDVLASIRRLVETGESLLNVVFQRAGGRQVDQDTISLATESVPPDGTNTGAEGSALHLPENVRQLLAQVDEKIEQLSDQQAAAAHTLQALSQANADTHQRLQQVRASRPAAQVSSVESTPDALSPSDQTPTSDNHGTAGDTQRRLDELHAAIDAGEKRLQTFFHRTEEWERRNESLRQEFETIQAALTEIESGPRAVLDQARTQAEQLERICQAVRKVSARLARNTLDAQTRTDELQRTLHETTQRISALTGHTQRAAQTLHTWVDEAVRAQTRLQETLAECPSPSETHPREALTEIARESRRIAGASSRLTPTAVSGELRMLHQPPSAEQTPEAEPKPSRTRSDEVADMLEEARQVSPTHRNPR